MPQLDVDHTHGGFEPPPTAVADMGGATANLPLLGQLMGAAHDGCPTCQDVLLTLIAEDPATTARLVELACLVVCERAGVVPPCMYADAEPGPATPEFRRMVRVGIATGDPAMVLRECELMSPAQRRQAANTAADTIVGLLPR